MALWEKDNILISQLAQRTGLTKATMTPLLRRLEEKGLINRVVPDDNERQKNIVLTDSGRELSFKSEEVTKQAFCATTLSESESKDIIALCKKITYATK